MHGQQIENVRIARFKSHKLDEVWRAALQLPQASSACKAVYNLLISLEQRFERSEQFIDELSSMFDEAEKMYTQGLDASAPNVLRNQCPILWGYLSNLIRLEETQKVLLLDCAKYEKDGATKAWINGITFGSGALTKEEWEQRSGNKTQQENQNEARFKFLIKVIEGCRAKSSFTPETVVTQMNKLGGPFELRHGTEGKSSVVRTSSTEKHSSTQSYSLGLTRRKSSIYFP